MLGKIYCRLLTKETSFEVARIIEKVYPDGHKKLVLPDAETAWRDHENKDNLVALCFAGSEAIGMISLKRSSNNARLYELGMLSVVKEYRQSDAANCLVSFASKDFGLHIDYDAIFMESVTSHYYSQRKAAQNGSIDCAIALSATPELAGGGRRQNFVVAFFENPLACSPPIYIPHKYADNLMLFYQGLKPRKIMPLCYDSPASIMTKAEVQEWPTFGLLRQNYFAIGEDLPEYINTVVAYAQKNKTSTLQVLLPLSSSYVGFATELFDQAGFFMAGVLPYWFGGDMLFLQRCFSDDWTKPKLYSKKARQLWLIIQKDREKNRLIL